jgi:N-ethylmaleimide reductase
MKSLFEPVQLGSLTLPNRIFMAPLTRNRANSDGVHSDVAVTYYSQRASAGLIITEATQISPMGKGYANTPGIHSSQQVHAWRNIVDAVHRENGRIFLQLWHVGRISHSSLLPNNAQPVAPSAVRANSQTHIATGSVPVSQPVALTVSGIKETVADYRAGALNAKEAGFDGVEIHAANGYLIDQFLQSGTNQRTDEYGGSVTNRIRFLSEVAQAVSEVWNPSQIGVRLSPRGTFNDMKDENPESTFMAAVAAMSALGLGYLHVVEASPGDAPPSPEFASLFDRMRRSWPSVYIANGGFNGPSGDEAVRSGRADAIAYGRLFIANPDLPKRLQLRATLNTPEPTSFYGGGAAGYTSYPALS